MSFKFKKCRTKFHASEISPALPECKAAKRLAHKTELAGEYTLCAMPATSQPKKRGAHHTYHMMSCASPFFLAERQRKYKLSSNTLSTYYIYILTMRLHNFFNYRKAKSRTALILSAG